MNFDSRGNVAVAGIWSNGNFRLLRDFVYPGGTLEKPKDGIDPEDVADFARPGDIAGIIAIILTSIGVLSSLGTFCAFFLKRNLPEIRSICPNVCMVQIFALSLGYLQCLLMIDKPTRMICTIDSMYLAILFSFYYGLVFAKSYRIYSIFTSAGRRSVMHDWILYAIALTASAPTAIIILCWNLIQAPVPSVKPLTLTSYYWTCSSNHPTESYAYASLLMWNFLILLANLILAFKSRTIPSKYYDGKMTALSIYNTAIILTFLLIIVANESLGFRIKLFVKLLGVFYILSFNLSAVFISKLLTIRRGDTQNRTQFRPSSKEHIGRDVTDIVRMRRNDGLYSVFSEEKVCVLRAITQDIVLMTPMQHESMESNEVTEHVKSIALCYNNVYRLEFEKMNNNCFKLRMNTLSFLLSFEVPEGYRKWMELFQFWRDRLELNTCGITTAQVKSSKRDSSNGEILDS
jgi:hypothetical protein